MTTSSRKVRHIAEASLTVSTNGGGERAKPLFSCEAAALHPGI